MGVDRTPNVLQIDIVRKIGIFVRFNGAEFLTTHIYESLTVDHDLNFSKCFECI